MNMNPVVHFEMPAKDKNRMRNFYETAFGWQTEQLGFRYCEIKESIRGW